MSESVKLDALHHLPKLKDLLNSLREKATVALFVTLQLGLSEHIPVFNVLFYIFFYILHLQLGHA